MLRPNLKPNFLLTLLTFGPTSAHDSPPKPALNLSYYEILRPNLKPNFLLVFLAFGPHSAQAPPPKSALNFAPSEPLRPNLKPNFLLVFLAFGPGSTPKTCPQQLPLRKERKKSSSFLPFFKEKKQISGTKA
jgi:hypothetical protein